MDSPERLWSRVDRTAGPIGCWPWTGANTGRVGHGRIRWGDTTVMTHRLAWELTFGPIPPGLSVLHSCDNPPCCNPEHLMVGTTRANMVDAGRKGRMGVGKNATHCKRGHAFEGNTYIHPQTGRRGCHECITARSLARPNRPRPDRHWAVPTERGCAICGERVHQAPAGKSGTVVWRHSRHHKAAEEAR